MILKIVLIWKRDKKKIQVNSYEYRQMTIVTGAKPMPPISPNHTQRESKLFKDHCKQMKKNCTGARHKHGPLMIITAMLFSFDNCHM